MSPALNGNLMKYNIDTGNTLQKDLIANSDVSVLVRPTLGSNAVTGADEPSIELSLVKFG